MLADTEKFFDKVWKLKNENDRTRKIKGRIKMKRETSETIFSHALYDELGTITESKKDGRKEQKNRESEQEADIKTTKRLERRKKRPVETEERPFQRRKRPFQK